MLSNLRKLQAILNHRELIQLGVLLVAIITMSFLQALGIASVLPFIGLIMDPELIFKNRWLNEIYQLLNFQSINSFIVFAGFTMFFLIIFSNVVSALATRLNIKFGLMLNHRISRSLMEKYLSMPYAFFLNRNSADLSNKILTEVGQLTSGYVTQIIIFITRCLLSLFILAMLVLINIRASLIALTLIGGTYAVLYLRVNRSLSYRGLQQAETNQYRFKAASEAFGGIKEIKVFNREKHFLESYSYYSIKLAQLSSWHQVLAQLPRYGLEAVAFGGIIVFVLFLMLTQQDAIQVIPLASLFAFAGYRLMPAIQELFTTATSIKYYQPVLDRLYSDITTDLETEHDRLNNNFLIQNPMSFNNEISLNEITYTFPNCQKPVLNRINLTIKHNTAVAFVGPTGAGKTTLVDIILGLLFPQIGSVSIDGIELDSSNIKNWQRNLGYVPQHIYLSDDTIAKNIAFGLSELEIDLDAVKRAARIANIDGFINEELPIGYDTIIGERGIRLSGGQRQRIGIARAVYHDPAVLIFDEATSALDGVTEDLVLDALESAAKSKTLIVIAHRITTVKNFDMIYVLDKGIVKDSGTYQQLMDSNTVFQRMAKKFVE